MTPLQLQSMMEDLVQVTGSDGYSIVAHDGHTSKRLQDSSGTHIMAVYPTTSYNDDEPDFAQRVSTHYLFVLEKDDAGQTLEKEVQQYQHLYEKTMKIVDYLTGEGSIAPCVRFPNLALSRLTIDPEYRIFAGWNGYSLSFTL